MYILHWPVKVDNQIRERFAPLCKNCYAIHVPPVRREAGLDTCTECGRKEEIRKQFSTTDRK